MDLTAEERDSLLQILREEHEVFWNQLGCTCDRKWALSADVFGPHKLPGWYVQHEDHCEAAKKVLSDG